MYGVFGSLAENKTGPVQCTTPVGREEEIRTLDTVARIHTFQACSFNHSDTSLFGCVKLRLLIGRFRLVRQMVPFRLCKPWQGDMLKVHCYEHAVRPYGARVSMADDCHSDAVLRTDYRLGS